MASLRQNENMTIVVGKIYTLKMLAACNFVKGSRFVYRLHTNVSKGPFTQRRTSYVNLCATTDDVVRCRPLSSIVVRYCPLSPVVTRQITCIGMLMICKYSSEMAEYAVADVVMAAATFFRDFRRRGAGRTT